MNEYQVSSLVVHCLPEKATTLIEEIEKLEGVEVPINENGKLIVVVESYSRKALMNVFDQIKALPGVLATLFVFHQVEGETDNDKKNLKVLSNEFNA